jgi:hypothetical protein
MQRLAKAARENVISLRRAEDGDDFVERFARVTPSGDVCAWHTYICMRRFQADAG